MMLSFALHQLFFKLQNPKLFLINDMFKAVHLFPQQNLLIFVVLKLVLMILFDNLDIVLMYFSQAFLLFFLSCE